MANKNITSENSTKIITAPKLSDGSIYVIYRDDGHEVEVHLSNDGIKAKIFKLTQAEENYFLKILENGDYRKRKKD